MHVEKLPMSGLEPMQRLCENSSCEGKKKRFAKSFKTKPRMVLSKPFPPMEKPNPPLRREVVGIKRQMEMQLQLRRNHQPLSGRKRQSREEPLQPPRDGMKPPDILNPVRRPRVQPPPPGCGMPPQAMLLRVQQHRAGTHHPMIRRNLLLEGTDGTRHPKLKEKPPVTAVAGRKPRRQIVWEPEGT
uniref:Uncharacterized protein n=2 Tax=Cacopsylla melanoneura TaxID=428564 RepID=A0A8D8T6I5_9HEMI